MPVLVFPCYCSTTSSADAELLARRRLPLRNGNRSVEHLRPEKSLHQLVMGAVAKDLRLHANRGGVLDRVAWTLARETPLEDPLGGPPVDGVRGHLDLEHPVRDVLANPRAGRPAWRAALLERFELAPAFVDRDDPGLGLELGFDRASRRPCGRSRAPSRRPRWRTTITTSSASWPPASAKTDRRDPGSAETSARSLPLTRDQPPETGSGTSLWRQSETREPGVGRDLDRRPRRDLHWIEEQARSSAARPDGAGPATA